MGLLGDWPEKPIKDAVGAKAAELWGLMLDALHGIRAHAQDTSTATIGTARTLAFQYGVPPMSGANIQPRSMTALPFLQDLDVSDVLTVDVYQERGALASSGYVANVGDAELLFAWYGVDRSSTGFVRLPANASIQVPCIVRGVLVKPADPAQPGTLQVSFS